MKVIDTYFDEKSVPHITYILNALYLYDSKVVNEVKILKQNYGNNSFENEFQALLFEFNSLIDCEIRTEGIYKKCQSIRYPNIYIVIPGGTKKAKILQNSLKKKYNLLNETLFKEFKKFVAYPIIKYPQLSSKYSNTNKNFSEKIFSLDRSYWKKNSIIRFSTKFKKVSENPFYSTFDKNFLKFQSNGNNYLQWNNYFEWSKAYFLTKKSFEFLGTPYKSSCSHYDSNDTIFNSFSNEHCVQRCIRYHCQIKFNCSCPPALTSDRNIFSLNEFDHRFNEKVNCNSSNLSISLRKYYNFCTDLCPNDCIIDDYIYTEKCNNEKLYSDLNRSEITIQWDDSKPLILNKETPVMTFNEYFCYIGGLFGMWFGISANQLINKLKENYVIYYRNFIDFSLILFYTSLEIIFFIKSKILSIIRH
jgi:hypothetical protein